MSKRLQQWLSCYLVLSLLLAGWVGLSPDLHRLVEHHGQGPAHTHRGPTATAHADSDHAGLPHAHPHPHSHASSRSTEATSKPGFFANNHTSFSLPSFPLQSLWQALIHFLESPAAAEGAPPDSSPTEDNRDHQHHSLAQSLSSGLLELSVDAPLLRFGPLPSGSAFPSPDELLLARILDAQSAGRAPPRA